MIPILILCPWLVLVLQAQFASLPTWGSQRMGRARRVLRASGKYGNSTPVLPLAICTLRSPCRGGGEGEPAGVGAPAAACSVLSPLVRRLERVRPILPPLHHQCQRVQRAADGGSATTPPPWVLCCVVGAGRDQRPTGCCKQGVDETKKNDIQGSPQFRMEWWYFCRSWRQII